jgi:hypothetical protein
MTGSRLNRASIFTLIVMGLLLCASVALADALVVVQLRGDDPADGTVTLTARQGEATFSCHTRNGTCRMDEVPGGSYSVRFQPDEGDPGPVSQAMIPPTGTVTLHVATRR